MKLTKKIKYEYFFQIKIAIFLKVVKTYQIIKIISSVGPVDKRKKGNQTH